MKTRREFVQGLAKSGSLKAAADREGLTSAMRAFVRMRLSTREQLAKRANESTAIQFDVAARFGFRMT